MRKVVLVPIFGDYDALKTPSVITEGWEYFVVSDKEYKHPLYKSIVVTTQGSNKLKTGMVITKPDLFIESDIIIVVGGQMEMNFDLNSIELNTDIKLMYSEVKGMYEEAIRCLWYRKDNNEKIVKQIQTYFDEGLPDNTGMIATGFSIRKNTKKMKEFGSLWFEQLLKYSERDQLSFNYTFWKHPELITYSTFPIEFWNNFKIHDHAIK